MLSNFIRFVSAFFRIFKTILDFYCREIKKKFLVIDTVLALVLRVPHGVRQLLQAGFKRGKRSQISVEKMPEKWTSILPPLPAKKALQAGR
jgi:hypothetical protein